MDGFSFWDIHSHIIYGVDDGARNRETMTAMLDATAADGVSSIIATSHASPGLRPFPREEYEARLEEARQYCLEKGYSLNIYPGAEILYSSMLERFVRERLLPTLGGTDYVLVEFMPDIPYAQVDSAVSMMEGSGYRVILAHVERYDCLYRGNAYRLKEDHSVQFQVNCGTVIGGLGFFRTRQIRRWFRDEIIDFVSSDCHGVNHRPTRMREAFGVLKEAYGEAYALRLTARGIPIQP